jgi:cytochrome c oxidase cbb3-type subunit 4
VELNTLRSLVTVICFLMFAGILAWAYSSRNRESFDEAARLPFDEDERAPGSAIHGESGK